MRRSATGQTAACHVGTRRRNTFLLTGKPSAKSQITRDVRTTICVIMYTIFTQAYLADDMDDGTTVWTSKQNTV